MSHGIHAARSTVREALPSEPMGSKLWGTVAVLTVAAVNGLAAYGCAGTEGTSSAGATSGPDSGPVPKSCSVSAPTKCPDPAPKYADVVPIFEAKCATC